ncbi:MAG TPA: mechanosensitive ion channel family protein [Saprospiraceae bacterium]|nr:mechanosensitive ion channel family protein [Saprospiraceae bacterium]HMQ84684.1 mechanosensitive ion channel family protein [Saprospiraceae bacterium]
MQNFLNDLLDELDNYYNLFVSLFPKLVLALFLLVMAWFVANTIGRFSLKLLKRRMDDPLLADFLSKIVKIVISIIGFLIALRIIGLGDAAASILAGAGISAFIIGFAFKDIGENFLAGIIMAFNRPFRIGDVIESGNVVGKIERLSLRDTLVKTFDGKDVYIPNGLLLKTPLFNYTIDGYLRSDFSIGIDYDSDLPLAVEVITKALHQVKGILWEEKVPTVVIDNLGNSTVNIKVYYWINTFDKNTNGLIVKSQAIVHAVNALIKAGFYLPTQVVELKNYNETILNSGQIGKKGIINQ